MRPDISIVIPVRAGGSAQLTLSTLDRATQGVTFEIIVSHDSEGRGANYARNAGAKLAAGRFLLFSDDDIEWMPGAIHALLDGLEKAATAAYSYGAYWLEGTGVQCDREFSADALRRANYISTMSLIRAETFPGFDERIERLQDWDIFLSMLEAGHAGVLVPGVLLFRTYLRDGITQGGKVSYRDARAIVRLKHRLADEFKGMP